MNKEFIFLFLILLMTTEGLVYATYRVFNLPLATIPIVLVTKTPPEIVIVTETAPPQPPKEVIKIVEVIKYITVEPEVEEPVVIEEEPVIVEETPEPEECFEPAVTLSNHLGIEYGFSGPTINRKRIQDLLDVGFFVTFGTLPGGIVTENGTTTDPCYN